MLSTLLSGDDDHTDVHDTLTHIQQMIIDTGIDNTVVSSNAQHLNVHYRTSRSQSMSDIEYGSSVRGRLWQAMLIRYQHIKNLTADTYSSQYIDLCQLGANSSKYEKIRVDSARTFPQDISYNRVVDQCSLIRLLNAFTHAHMNTTPTFTYIQGMNTLAATFLYVMSELDAYHMFTCLLTDYIPLYYQSSHIGVNAGCALVDNILQHCDTQLYDKLSNQHGLHAYIYAFSAVSSLCTSVLPLHTAIELWDWLMAAQAPALNVVCVAAQIIMIRDKLLMSAHPKSILDYRVWPQLAAADIIAHTRRIISSLQTHQPMLLQDIVSHASDVDVCQRNAGRKIHH